MSLLDAHWIKRPEVTSGSGDVQYGLEPTLLYEDLLLLINYRLTF